MFYNICFWINSFRIQNKMRVALVGGAILLLCSLSPQIALAQEQCGDLLNQQAHALQLEYQKLKDSGEPLTFEKALDLVRLTLTAEEKEAFDRTITMNFSDRQLQVNNQTGLRARFGENRLQISSPWRQPFTAYKERRAKITWKAKSVKNEKEFLLSLFDAIRIVHEPEIEPISALGVYLKGPRRSAISVVETAKRILQLEYSVYDNLSEEGNIKLPRAIDASSTMTRWLKYMNLWPMGWQPWAFQDLQLDMPLAKSLKERDEKLFDKMVKQRWGRVTAIQWMVKHLSSVRNVVYICVVLWAGPQAFTAYNYVHDYLNGQITAEQVQAEGAKFRQNVEQIILKNIKVEVEKPKDPYELSPEEKEIYVSTQVYIEEDLKKDASAAAASSAAAESGANNSATSSKN